MIFFNGTALAIAVAAAAAVVSSFAVKHGRIVYTWQLSPLPPPRTTTKTTVFTVCVLSVMVSLLPSAHTMGQLPNSTELHTKMSDFTLQKEEKSHRVSTRRVCLSGANGFCCCYYYETVLSPLGFKRGRYFFFLLTIFLPFNGTARSLCIVYSFWNKAKDSDTCGKLTSISNFLEQLSAPLGGEEEDIQFFVDQHDWWRNLTLSLSPSIPLAQSSPFPKHN